jgi:biotin operon repressor
MNEKRALAGETIGRALAVSRVRLNKLLVEKGLRPLRATGKPNP